MLDRITVPIFLNIIKTFFYILSLSFEIFLFSSFPEQLVYAYCVETRHILVPKHIIFHKLQFDFLSLLHNDGSM